MRDGVIATDQHNDPESLSAADGGWPLTEAQTGLWYAQRVAPENPAFNTAHALWITGQLDVSVFATAADQAARESAALGLRIGDGRAGPRQFLDATRRPTLQVVDLGQEADPAAVARQRMARDRLAPVDPTCDCLAVQRLYVLGGRRWVWYLRVHHLVTDGYGMALFTDRVCALYGAALAGTGSVGGPLSELAPVLAEDADYRTSDKRRRDAEYWRERMAGAPAAAGLTSGFAAAGHDCLRHVVTLEAGLREQILATAERLGQPWPDLLTALCGEYCRRMAGQQETIIGVPFMGRLGSASARVPAMVMNVLPLRVPAHPGMPIAELVGSTARELIRARRHGRYRGEQLRRDLGLVGGRRRLYGPLVNMQPFYRPPRLGGARVALEILSTGPVEDVTLGFRGDGPTALDLEIEANPALYDEAELAAHAERLLAFVAAACEADSLDQVPLASPAEQRRVLVDFNATTHAVSDHTMVARIEAMMQAQPAATAVEFAGVTLSYADLERRSRALALQLQWHGVGRESLVAVALPRSLELIVALLAVVRAGAAYLPLDLAHPAERTERILRSARPRLALAGQGATACFGDTKVLPPAAWWSNARDTLSAGPRPHDAAYVIYTSGSTGEPKGVVVEHRAVVNRLEWMRCHYAVDATDRILQKTPATFDVSVWEFFLPLLAGATLVVAPPDAHRDPQALARLIRSAAITTLHFVPSMLQAFLAAPESDGLVVRRVFVSGEALAAELRNRFHARVKAELHNLYGPTEAAVDVTWWPAGPGDDSDPVPIGYPVWNTRLYVLDAQRRPLPPGVVGHLYLAGVQLARGYLGREDLTAERFISDPHAPGERMYDSGDLARWRPDGALEFLGRSDHQVKLRGLRIELGEIEAAVMQCSGSEHAAVVLREDRPGDPRLVAYLPADDRDTDQLRRQVADCLPDYMVPAAFVQLSDWPVTANGKLDRSALPEPVRLSGAGRRPAGASERALAPLFAQALGVAEVSAEADFFSLGGDSLSAVHLLLAIQRRFGRDPGLGALFATPTVAAIAARLDDEAVRAPDHGLGPIIQLARGDRDRAPLFVVHPAGGIAWCYRELARNLSPQRAVYGLQSPALDGAQPLPDGIDALAMAYVRRIDELWPDGPVHLAGWSVGGIIAQAMAVRLTELGRSVGLVALLDAYPAECWRNEPQPDPVTALRALLAVAGYDPDARPELTTRAAIVDFLRRGDSALGNLPDVVLDGVVRAVTDTNRLVREHHHRPFSGTILHLRAGHDHGDRPHLQSGLWQAHARRVEAVELPFLHSELTGGRASGRIGPLLDAHLSEHENT